MTDMSKEAFKYQCMCNLSYVSNSDKMTVEIGQGHLVEMFEKVSDERDNLRAELDEAKAEIERRHNAQSYTYIGKDGKSVQARDLEDERDALKAENEMLLKKHGVISKLMNLLLILQDPSDSRFAEAVNIAERIGNHMKGSSQ